MKKIYFGIALHFHQPIGNFEHIFERAYNLCYRPFLELLSEYPQLKMAFHISGCLLDYFEMRHPEMLKLIKRMTARGQIEIMGGAYYEPILTAVPERDIAGQIAMMSGYIKRRFNTVPKGMWVAERVWHPNLAKILYKSGVRYIILDNEHLLRSGVKKEDIHGYFLTGSGKEKITVFPSDKRLRYTIPFKPIHETLDYFKTVAGKRKNILLTYGDDGEKFGEWPGTHAHVFENQWLRNFFDMLKKNRSWIKLTHLSDYIKSYKPTATLTVQQGSYEEMMEWSDGCWLNFLSKYPEANQLHKKMLYVSSKIEEIKKKAKKLDMKKIENATTQLYQGQCNCAYWHGVFGGLYLYHLRQSVYKHLIEADKILDNVLHKEKKGWLDIKNIDFDMDGKDEVIAENKDFSIYIDPHEGGVVKELDYKTLSLNLVNALSRKRESYHQRILERIHHTHGLKVATIHDDFRPVDPAFRNMLFYDKFSRHFLRSYFVEEDLKLEDFIASTFKEVGDFSTENYRAEKKDKTIVLQREHKLLNTKVKLRKQIRILAGRQIEFSFYIENKGHEKLKALFGVEFNVTMPELNSEKYWYTSDGDSQKGINAEGYSFPVSSFGISDTSGELSINFNFSKEPICVLYFPVKTISQSERAYELNYQCSCIFPLWNLNLHAGDKYSFNVNFVLERG